MNTAILRERMTEKNIGVTEMSEAIGIGRKAFWSKCNGYTDFNRKEIARIIETLNLTNEDVEAIFFGPDVS